MKKCLTPTAFNFPPLLLICSLSLSGASISHAGDQVAEQDITDACCVFFGEPGLVGPGSISFVTKGDIDFSIGATTRIIPTYENNWDFGLSDVNGLDFNGQENFYVTHFTESGVNAGEYLRGQANLYLNALPKNHDWSFFMWLQADSTLDITSVDNNAGAGNQSSDFGIERLHVTGKIPGTNMRLHTGWALWDIDMGNAGGLVYLDDNPGVWLTGWNDEQTMDWSVGWFKLDENNSNEGATSFTVANGDENDHDRNLWAGFIDQKISNAGNVRYFYTFDDFNDVAVGESQRNYAGNTTSTIAAVDQGGADGSVHHIGATWTETFGAMSVMLQGVYETGDVENAGLEGVVVDTVTGETGKNSYDVDAYAFAGMLTLNTDMPMGITPRAGFQYTSGDDDAGDGELGGYTANLAGQRFTVFGGENTFMADGNRVLGTAIFGMLPEALGNGTPVFTGGIDNLAGFGYGRGDNPGLWMVNLGFTASPSKNTSFDSSVRVFGYNEDQVVSSMANGSTSRTEVDAGYAGTEWTNQLTYAMNSAVALKFQGSFLFPGQAIEDITEALGAGGAVNTKSDEIATRVAAELVWNF